VENPADLAQNVAYGHAIGWSFTPLIGKRPRLNGWQKADRETHGQAVEWAASGNVGLRCGAASADAEGRGLLVVDLDTAKGDGYDVVAARALHLPHKTVTARTGSGGWHLYYRLPAGVALGNSAGKLARGVDSRGDGGQVVFPGSIHPDTGKPYRWSAGCAPWEVAVADLPANVLAILTGQAPAPASSPADGEPSAGTSVAAPSPSAQATDAVPGPAEPPPAAARETRESRYARSALVGEIQKLSAAQEGTRGAALNASAFALGQLVGSGIVAATEATAALLAACYANGLVAKDGLRSVEYHIAHSLDAGGRDPRGLPPPAYPPPAQARPASSPDLPSGPSGSGPTVPQSPAHRPSGNARPAAAPPVSVHSDLRGTGTAAADPPVADWPHRTPPPGVKPALGELSPDGRLVLSSKRTLPTGLAYVREFHTRTEDGLRTIAAHAGRLLAWERNRYVELEDGAVRGRLHPWMHNAVEYTPSLDFRPFPANPATVSAALDTVRALVHVPGATDVPCWLSGSPDRPPAVEVLPCLSASLHIPTGDVLDPTPDLFSFNALDFDFDPCAPAPLEWLKFLDQLWPGDPGAVELLQEWFGYCLTPDTAQHKMLLLVGPRRSGKGTIGRVLAELIGEGNVAGPTTGSLAGPFGLQPLIGRSVAIVSDARFSGPELQTVVERLLCVSGEDRVTIDRKHLASVTMKLPTRFVFLTNELPRLHDVAGALAGRFLLLTLTDSFFGREDPGLTDRLLGELPGILRWALVGWERLHQRGRFIVPASSKAAEDMLADLTSPVSAFLRESTVTGADKVVRVEELYAAWKAWCEADGRAKVPTRQSFGRELAAVMPGLRVKRNHDTGRFYVGVSLRDTIPSLPGEDGQ
jgi:putative DNA primase/helicase